MEYVKPVKCSEGDTRADKSEIQKLKLKLASEQGDIAHNEVAER